MRTHSECRAVSRLLWAAVRRELLDPERVRVEAHLQRCRRCAVEAAGYRQAARHLEAYRASAPSPPPGGWHALRAQLLAAPPPAAPFSLRAARGPALAGAGAAVALALLFRWLPLHGTVRVASLPPDPHRRTPRTFALSPTRKRSSGYPSSPSTGLRLMARGPAAPAGPAPRVQHGERTPAQPVRRRRLAGAPARLVARVRAPRPLVPDEDYLDGRDPALIRAWGGRRGRDARVMELLRRQLPPMRDDFVAIPPPLLVALDPRGALAAQALAAWQREARKVDARLARQVTLELKGTAVEEFCAAIQAQTGVRLRAGRGVGDEKVTVFVKEKPARDVMRAVARLFGYKWMRTGEEGSYRYELSQDLKSQLAEEEMRNRDIHAALLALDDRMARYQPYVEQSVDPLLARSNRAKIDLRVTFLAA